MTGSPITLLLLLFLAGTLGSDGSVVTMVTDDRGYVTSCDPKTKITAWWEPRVLVVGHFYKASFDFTPTIDWKSGSLYASLWQGSDLIYKTTIPVSCQQVKQFPFLQCPIKKGKKISGVVPRIQFKLPVSLPAAKYKVRAEIKDDQGRDLICAEANLQIGSGGNEMEYGHDGKL